MKWEIRQAEYRTGYWVHLYAFISVYSASSISRIYQQSDLYVTHRVFRAFRLILRGRRVGRIERYRHRLFVEILFVVQLRNNPGTREKYEKVKGDVQASALAVIAYDTIFMATACAVRIILHYEDNGVYIFIFSPYELCFYKIN